MGQSVSRNVIDLVGIVHDAVKDGFSKRAVIATELVVPSVGVVLGTEDWGGLRISSRSDKSRFRFYLDESSLHDRGFDGNVCPI